MNTISTLLLLTCMSCFSATNVLELVWSQPPGYQSTLFSAENLAGAWTPLVTNSPPVSVTATQSQVFFYVVVTPTNSAGSGYSGPGDPAISAVKGSTYVNEINGSFWVNLSGDTNWVELIGG